MIFETHPKQNVNKEWTSIKECIKVSLDEEVEQELQEKKRMGNRESFR